MPASNPDPIIVTHGRVSFFFQFIVDPLSILWFFIRQLAVYSAVLSQWAFPNLNKGLLFSVE